MPDTKESAKERQIEFVKSDDFFRVYANSAQIETGPWDLRMTFGESTTFGDKVTIEQSVAVTMSLQHAKALLGVLANNLREYEKQAGEIKIPATPQEPTVPEKPSTKN